MRILIIREKQPAGHRFTITYEAEEKTPETIVQEILDELPVP